MQTRLRGTPARERNRGATRLLGRRVAFVVKLEQKGEWVQAFYLPLDGYADCKREETATQTIRFSTTSL
jgi:hypothetical protein